MLHRVVDMADYSSNYCYRQGMGKFGFKKLKNIPVVV